MAEAWKNTLFVWKGMLTKTENDQCEWTGTWIGIEEDEMPSDEEFKSSPNTFNIKGVITGEKKSIISWQEGSYLLDNGGGLEPYSDESHRTHFYTRTLLNYSVTLIQSFLDNEHEAVSQETELFGMSEGTTEFGAFQSKGIIERKRKHAGDTIERKHEGVVFTLARRYLPTKGDVRGKLPMEAFINASDLALEKPWFNLPVKIVNLNNRYMGMVRQWQEFFYGNRYAESYMDALPDFVKLAESYGHVGMKIENSSDIEGALKEAFSPKLKERLVFLDFITDQTENVFPMVASGKGLSEMILADDAEDL